VHIPTIPHVRGHGGVAAAARAAQVGRDALAAAEALSTVQAVTRTSSRSLTSW